MHDTPYPRPIANINESIFYTSNDNGLKLWYYNSETNSTNLLKELTTSISYSTSYNDKLFFTYDDGVHGSELWQSNGTPEGTVLVKDINPGTGDSNWYDQVEVNGVLYFQADDATHGRELWKTDGTESGTVLVKDISVGSNGSAPYYLHNINGVLFFKTYDQLWKSDGTESGTVPVKDITLQTNQNDIIDVNGIAYFFASDDSHGNELWKSDGTESGTVMVKDINPGSNDATESGVYSSLTSMGSHIYFFANDGIHGHELWHSDGTEAGTTLVKDISVGIRNAISSQNFKLNHARGVLFFAANDGTHGEELWKSDGTPAGTVMVKNIHEFYGSSLYENININGTLYFSANGQVHGQELWKTDGTSEGTVQVTDIATGTDSSSPSYMIKSGNSIIFSARESANETPKLWQVIPDQLPTAIAQSVFTSKDYSVNLTLSGIDPDGNELTYSLISQPLHGTLSGTAPDLTYTPNSDYTGGDSFNFKVSDGSDDSNLAAISVTTLENNPVVNDNLIYQVKDIHPGGDPKVTESIKFKDELYFSADDGVNGKQLWKSDGTEQGTVLLKVVNPSYGSSLTYYPVNWTVTDNYLYFTVTTSEFGKELYRTDGTPEGSILVKDIITGSTGFDPRNLTGVNDTLYFTDPSIGSLWKSDGTSAGTIKVIDSPAYQLTNFNGTLYFIGIDSTYGREIWKSDGTAAGTIRVTDINPGSADASPNNFTNMNGSLYFTATDTDNGKELWKSDGTSAGTTLVKDLTLGVDGSIFGSLFANNDLLYFSLNQTATGAELWRSDGTSAGTYMVKDIYPGSTNSNPAHLSSLQSLVYFYATDDTNGRELWKTDGTENGTQLVKDTTSGVSSTGIWSIDVVNNTIYLGAESDLGLGIEPWISDGTDAGTVQMADINTGGGHSRPFGFINIGGKVLFSADDGTGGKLWSLNANQAPIASNTTFTTTEDQTLSLALPATDHDGNTLTYTFVSQPTSGTLSGTGPNVTYTPNANLNGSDSFTFNVSDGFSESSLATITIITNPLNDAPSGDVTITGTVTVGQTLTASHDLADADGLGVLSYQWLRDGTDIINATAATYTLGDADTGSVIHVTAHYTDGHGTLETVTSASSTIVTEVDSDGDGSPDSEDAFPSNNAAFIDDDIDGHPDHWSDGCDVVCQGNSGLSRDAFPNNNAAFMDSDGDGHPDKWNESCDKTCRMNSGLKLDAFPNSHAAFIDDDVDGHPDHWSEDCDVVCQGKSGLVLDVSINDADNDGLTDQSEGALLSPARDTDGDGQIDALDLDSDNDGLLDSVENTALTITLDTDKDGIPDYVDAINEDGESVDVDNDGISDAIECPSYPNCPDSDEDGQPDYTETDSDNDGVLDSLEAGPYVYALLDTDGDGITDFKDKDSDNDGFDDELEAIVMGVDEDGFDIYLDSDGDSIPDYLDRNDTPESGTDNDLDTIRDDIECPIYPACADSDLDGQPDYTELDSDNDGMPDSLEVGNDVDNPLDSDGDGIANYQDTDSDNDGFLDVNEWGPNPDEPLDSNSNGIPDVLDSSNNKGNNGEGNENRSESGTENGKNGIGQMPLPLLLLILGSVIICRKKRQFKLETS